MAKVEVSKGLENFLNYVRMMTELHRMAEANRAEAEAETQDLLHALELGDYRAKEQARLARKLREVRRARRESKDIGIQTAPVAAWAEQNSGAIKSLERLLGEVRKAERRGENRSYTPRTKVLEEVVGKEAGG